MGCDCKLNILNGANIYDIICYLQTKYEVVYNGFAKNKNTTHEFITIKSPDLNEPRSIFVMIYDCAEQLLHDNENIKTIPGESLYLSLHSEIEGINILTNIAKHFGGYLCENDCADCEDINYYKYFVGENNKNKDKLFELLNKNFSVGIALEFTDFIRNNIEEIKKCL